MGLRRTLSVDGSELEYDEQPRLTCTRQLVVNEEHLRCALGGVDEEEFLCRRHQGRKLFELERQIDAEGWPLDPCPYSPDAS